MISYEFTNMVPVTNYEQMDISVALGRQVVMSNPFTGDIGEPSRLSVQEVRALRGLEGHQIYEETVWRSGTVDPAKPQIMQKTEYLWTGTYEPVRFALVPNPEDSKYGVAILASVYTEAAIGGPERKIRIGGQVVRFYQVASSHNLDSMTAMLAISRKDRPDMSEGFAALRLTDLHEEPSHVS